MGLLKKLFGLIGGSDQSIQKIASGLRCALCGRRIEEGQMPLESISEWYNEWVPQGWFQGEQLLLKCQQCGRTYCSDCVPRFWQAINDPIFAPQKCSCGKREFLLIPGRQCGSRI